MDKRKRGLGKVTIIMGICIFAVLVIRFCTVGGNVEQRTLRVSNYGYTESRLTSLGKAVEKFNASHSDVQYTIEFNHYMDGIWDWDRYNDMTEQFLQDEEGWDIFTIPGEYIGRFASRGYLLPLDDVVENVRYENEYFSPLIPKTKFLGHTWGALIEMDMRVAYFNKKVLEALGYSKSEIEEIPVQIRNGEMTQEDVEALAANAVEQGLAQYGIIHRPRYGTFFYGVAQEYDAFSIDETGKVRFDGTNFTRMLEFYQRISRVNQEPNPMEWSEVNDIYINGDAAVYLGDNWTIYDCVMERGGNEEKLLDQYVAALLPAVSKGGKPYSISNTMQIAVSAKCKYPEDVKEILADAYSDWDALAEHCAESYRLPVARSIVESPVFSESAFLNSLMYMTDYSFFMPYMEDNQRWMKALYQTVCSVENGSGTPEEVAHMFGADIENEWKD